MVFKRSWVSETLDQISKSGNLSWWVSETRHLRESLVSPFVTSSLNVQAFMNKIWLYKFSLISPKRYNRLALNRWPKHVASLVIVDLSKLLSSFVVAIVAIFLSFLLSFLLSSFFFFLPNVFEVTSKCRKVRRRLVLTVQCFVVICE